MAGKFLFVAATLLASVAAAGGVVFAASGPGAPAPRPAATCPASGGPAR